MLSGLGSCCESEGFKNRPTQSEHLSHPIRPEIHSQTGITATATRKHKATTTEGQARGLVTHVSTKDTRHCQDHKTTPVGNCTLTWPRAAKGCKSVDRDPLRTSYCTFLKPGGLPGPRILVQQRLAWTKSKTSIRREDLDSVPHTL